MKNYTRWMLLVGAAIVLTFVTVNFKSITSAQERGKGGKADDASTQQGGAQKVGPTKRDRSMIRKPGEAKEENPDLPTSMNGKINFEAYFIKRQEHINLLLGMGDDGSYNPLLRVKAILQMEQQEAKLKKDLKYGQLAQPMISATTWTPIGPQPIPNGQTSIVPHPVSGRTTAIAIHPTNPDIVFISSANGGVFRSLNGGQTWTPIFDNAESLAIGALAFAPSDPTILYVGTGESNLCGSGCFAGIGVYRIDNALTTADLVGPINPTYNFTAASTGQPAATGTFTGRSISDILVHPTQPGTIFVSTTSGVVGNPNQSPGGGTIPPTAIRGLWRSTNATAAAGSVTFQKLAVAQDNCFDTPCTGNHNITGIRLDPGDPNILVAFVIPLQFTAAGGVWRTADALAANPTFTNQFNVVTTRGEFGVTRGGGTTTMYLASGESPAGTSCTLAPSASNGGAVRKSTDGGLTWVKQTGGGGFCGGQCFYDISIQPDLVDPNIVHLGGSAQGTCSRVQARSTDGGTTFVRNDTGLHADTQVTMVAPSNTNIVYTGSDGGIWRSVNRGVTWTSLNNTGYSATQFQGMDIHPFDRFLTLGGTQDNGTQLMLPEASGDPNKPINQWRRAESGDGGYALVDKSATDTNNVTLYHTFFNQQNAQIGFQRVSRVDCAFPGQWAFKGFIPGFNAPSGFVSACGDVEAPNGITNDPVLFYAPMDLGPSLLPGTPNTLYFGTDRLYRSIDRGDTMMVASQAPLVAGARVSTIWVSKTDDNARMVGLTNGRVFATRTGLNALTEVTPTGAPVRAVGRVFIDPTNSSVAYIAYGGQGIPAVQHIWKTTNLSDVVGTTTWTATANGIPDVPVNAFAIDPADPTHLYAGTDIGVYTSQDGGATWVPYGTGLPRVAVFQMAIQNANRFLRIATHSRGIWEIALTPPTALSISGNVTGLAAGETATVTLTGSSSQSVVVAGPTGAYVFNALSPGGNYTVKVLRTGTRFAPPFRTYTDIAASQSSQDFASSEDSAGTPPSPGQVLISEFRLRGKNGAADEFIELYNNTDSAITVGTTDGSSGWAVDGTSGGARENVAIIPNGTVIPARKHFLLASGGYSLVRYANANMYYQPNGGADLDDDTGLALYPTSNRANFTAANRLDAVGFTGAPAENIEGGALTPVGTSNTDYSFVRKLLTGTPQDTNQNNQDFVLVSTSTAAMGAAQPVLGAPGPQNSLSPRQDTARDITVTFYDPTVSSAAFPNRERNGADAGVNRSYGTMTIRRRFTNNSGQRITRIRFRVVDISTSGNTVAGQADLRLLDSSDQRVNSNTATTPVTRTVRGTLIEQLPMQQPNGGGLNTTLTLINQNFFNGTFDTEGLDSTVAGVCPPSQVCAVDVQFMIGVEREGAFRFVVSLEGLP